MLWMEGDMVLEWNENLHGPAVRGAGSRLERDGALLLSVIKENDSESRRNIFQSRNVGSAC